MDDVRIEKEPRATDVKISRRPSLLVVDDDDDFRELMTMYFEDLGFHVATAASGEAAIDYVRRTASDVVAAPPDVIMLDICMPEHSGLTVMEMLRRQGFTGEIIVVTAYVDHAVDERARLLGASHVLHKPFEASALRELVREGAARAACGQTPITKPRK